MTDRPDVSVSIKRLPHGQAIALPAYQSDLAAGMDVSACLDAPVTIAPGDIAVIPLGFAMAVPAGYEAQIRPRSGLASKFGITLPNSPGTVDADYRGEVKVALINLGQGPFVVEPAMRIAQMLVLPVPRVAWAEVDELPATERGAGGFGHTGS